MKSDKKGTRGSQQTLDGVMEKLPETKVYACEDATHAVAQLVACDDQVHVMMVQYINADMVR